ncbi:MAG: endonuclease MutS2 [Oligosphaeraceae bacterium]
MSEVKRREKGGERSEEHSRRVLGYDRLLEEIGEYAQSAGGRRRVLALRPRYALGEIQERRGLYEDLMKLGESAFGLPSLGVEELTAVLLRVQPSDALLDGMELRLCLSQLQTVWELERFLQGSPVQGLASLQAHTRELAPCHPLREALSRSLDQDGSLLDRASERLWELRRNRAVTERRLQRTLEELIHDTSLDGVLRERFVTQRNGRYVVPVRRDAPSRMPGLVHDVSSSGQTLFVEPSCTLSLGNELSTLLAEEREECRRILAELSQGVRQNLAALQRNGEILEELDAAAAVARWAGEYSCLLPAFGGYLRLEYARHPLLESQFRREGAGRKVVPLNLQLPKGTTTLAITGSNTGGKTVTLKTIGLLAMAAQSGLPVPAGENSLFPVCQRILADIGDEQSLSENLSTFSGHLAQIGRILRESGEPGESMVLLDELGSGTDPAEGAAIACAILRELSCRRGLTVVTTHLGDVKNFVHATPGMLNGAVRFDMASLQPEYVLELGHPGASHALAIARRLGIPAHVLKSAEGFLSGEERHWEEVLSRLEEERRMASQERGLAKAARQEAEAARQENLRLQAELRNTRKQRLHDSMQEAQSLLDNARRQVENLLRELRESGARKGDDAPAEAAAKAREWIARRQEELEKGLRQTAQKPATPRLPRKEWTVGRRIWVERLGAHGKILRVDEKRGMLEVDVNGLPFQMKCPEVFPEQSPEPPRPEGSQVVVRAPLFQGQTSHELLLVGMRVDDALMRMERYLNQCLLARLQEVRIVHGFGTGRLREAVHQFLRRQSYVQSFQLGTNPMEGGGGVTFVRLAPPEGAPR